CARRIGGLGGFAYW
nr:immunoglobulin heavy chain junction region [Mus musculus]